MPVTPSGVISDDASATATRLSHRAAAALGHHAEQAFNQLAHTANQYSQELGDHVVSTRQDRTRARRKRG